MLHWMYLMLRLEELEEKLLGEALSGYLGRTGRVGEVDPDTDTDFRGSQEFRDYRATLRWAMNS